VGGTQAAGEDVMDVETVEQAVEDAPEVEPEAGPGPPPEVVPVVSVGALNPSRNTDALFSNGGRWVRVYMPGAAVMSTIPPFQGGLQPMARTRAFDRWRESLDPDDFVGGFAVWSGTSFAAPILAGVFAEQLSPLMEPEGSTVDDEEARGRAWELVRSLTPIRREELVQPLR
jgi:subtilisin family serine protease